MTFSPLSPDADRTLHWRQPTAAGQRWVLASEGAEHGALWLDAESGTSFLAATATGQWRLRSSAGWKRVITIHSMERDDLLASLTMTTVLPRTRAVLTDASGTSIGEWHHASFLKGVSEWRSGAGTLWQTYRSGVDEGGVAAWWRNQCRVDFTPEGFAHAQRDLMCCAGWLLAMAVASPKDLLEAFGNFG
jgi:hypothetical protein